MSTIVYSDNVLDSIFGEDLESVKDFFCFTDKELRDYIERDKNDVKPLCQMLKYHGNIEQIFLDCRDPEVFLKEDHEFYSRLKVLICRRIPELILSETSSHLIFHHSVVNFEFGSFFIKVRPENSYTRIPVLFLNREKLKKPQFAVSARKCDVEDGVDYENVFFTYQGLEENAKKKWEEFDKQN